MDFGTILRAAEKHKRIKEGGESPLSDIDYAGHVDARDLDEAVSLRNLERVPTDETPGRVQPASAQV